MIEVFSMQAGL